MPAPDLTIQARLLVLLEKNRAALQQFSVVLARLEQALTGLVAGGPRLLARETENDCNARDTTTKKKGGLRWRSSLCATT